MTKPITAHVFTFGPDVCSGETTKIALDGRAVKFDYEYSSRGENVPGAFLGEVSKGDHVLGDWIEKPSGRKEWKGKAEFRIIDAEGRRTLVGVWSSNAGGGRWLIDLG